MRVITILGPSQSGKTTLAEALAGLEGAPPRKLAVQEAACLRCFTFLGDDWAAIDIAGGADTLAFAGPALAASDAAVLCVPPEAEAAVLAAPYLRLIKASGVPCFVFINRMDAAADRVRDVLAALQTYCSHALVLRQIPIRQGESVAGAVDLISERAWEYREGERSALVELPEALARREEEARTELLESLADHDDALLEQLIEERQPMTEEVYAVAARVLSSNALVPVLLGAAGHGNGVLRLMKSLRHEAPRVGAARARLVAGGDGTVAVGFLADQMRHLGKVVVLRDLEEEGTPPEAVAPGRKLGGETLGGLAQIDAKTPLPALAPGAVGLTIKSDHMALARLYTAEDATPLPDWAAARPAGFRRIATPTNERDETRLSDALSRLVEVDPGLTVEQDSTSGHAILCTQGPLHARRLEEKLAADFGVEVALSPVPTPYRETLARRLNTRHRHRKQSGGAGQFADVVLELAPEPRGAGFRFDERVKGGAVPRNYIPAVESGARDALIEGPNGYPVVDISVTLTDGKHHAVDSSDHAFRTAAKNAVREALAEAGTVVLQPILSVSIHVPSVFAGSLVPVVSGLKGTVLGFAAHPDVQGWDVFRTLLPSAQQDALAQAVASASRGTGWLEWEFDHYEELRGSNHKRAGGSVPA